MRRIFNHDEILYAMLNQQQFANGTTIDLKDDGFVYFIFSVTGVNSSNAASVKDKNDNLKQSVTQDIDLHNPWRFDGGFKITADTAVYITYIKMAIS